MESNSNGECKNKVWLALSLSRKWCSVPSAIDDPIYIALEKANREAVSACLGCPAFGGSTARILRELHEQDRALLSRPVSGVKRDDFRASQLRTTLSTVISGSMW